MDHLLRSATDRRHIIYRAYSLAFYPTNILYSVHLVFIMHWKEVNVWYRVAVVIVQALLLLMIFVAIYPVAAQDVTIKNIGRETWNYDGKMITVKIPVNVTNDGFYDINRIITSISVRNSSAEFVSSTQDLGDVPHGTDGTLVIKIPIDIEHIYEVEQPNFYHFFHSDVFNVSFTISLKYLMDTVTMSTYYESKLDWEPIIKEFHVYPPSELERDGDEVIVNMPYTIETAHYLWGNASFNGSVACNAFSGTAYAEFPLGVEYNGSMRMVFNTENLESLITESQPMHITGKINIAGISVPVHTTYMWGAPLNGLKVEVLDNGTVHYTFKNDAAFAMNLHIDKKYYYQGNLVKEESEILHVPSGAYVNRYDTISVSSPVDRVVITIYDDDHGVYYQKVVNL